MYKIRLVLADFDNQYVDRLAEFINTHFSPQIKLSVYTQMDVFQNWCNSHHEPVDVLLAHPNFITSLAGDLSQFGLVVLLSEGIIPPSLEQFLLIDKFQPGDTLVNRLLKFYHENNGSVSLSPRTKGITKLVAVYSPAGGVGKTAITLGLATTLAEMGQTVLCLSLESINSLIPKLSSANQADEAGLSHLLLSLKENPDTLPIKLEMYKSTEFQRKFDFLYPPDHFLELAELTSAELKTLVRQVKDMGKYDVVLVDMDSIADEKNMTLLNYSDRIVLVRDMNTSSAIKERCFLQQLENMDEETKERILRNLIPVINKCQQTSLTINGAKNLTDEIMIPFVENLSLLDETRENFDITGQFVQHLVTLAQVMVD